MNVMTIIICALGALVGLVVALVCGKLALPFVLRKQQEAARDGRLDASGIPVPQALQDPQSVARLTIFIYRFVMPFVFAVGGALAAYQVVVGGLR
jgi:hypothetical protein